MVEELKKVLEKIVKKRGSVCMYAILKMDEYTEKWSIILSASWLNNTNTKEVYLEFRSLLLKYLSKESISQIARIGIFSKDEHIIEELLKYKKGTIINEDVQVNGNLIHEAYIIESNSTD